MGSFKMQKNIKKETKSTHNPEITTDNILECFLLDSPAHALILSLSLSQEIYTLYVTGVKL
jgi:hypothetical protein